MNYLFALGDLAREDEDMICTGDVPGVETRVVRRPDQAGALGTSVQLVVALGVGNQPALELGRNQPETEDFI